MKELLGRMLSRRSAQGADVPELVGFPLLWLLGMKWHLHRNWGESDLPSRAQQTGYWTRETTQDLRQERRSGSRQISEDEYVDRYVGLCATTSFTSHAPRVPLSSLPSPLRWKRCSITLSDGALLCSIFAARATFTASRF